MVTTSSSGLASRVGVRVKGTKRLSILDIDEVTELVGLEIDAVTAERVVGADKAMRLAGAGAVEGRMALILTVSWGDSALVSPVKYELCLHSRDKSKRKLTRWWHADEVGVRRRGRGGFFPNVLRKMILDLVQIQYEYLSGRPNHDSESRKR